MVKSSVKRRKFVVGNWKMNKSPSDALAHFNEFRDLTEKLVAENSIDVGLAVPSLYLNTVAIGRKHVNLFAQNCHWDNEGAYTGEISANMLQQIGVNGSLVAHSERRQMNAETDATAGTRAGALLRLGMQAILCVGESMAERKAGLLKAVLTRQLEHGIAASGARITHEFLGSDPTRPLLAIAYEPIWAIGTGVAASAAEAQEAHALIRSIIEHVAGKSVASKMRIIYGGSVNSANAKSFFSAPDVDGALVGGASLDSKAFASLCALSVAE